MEIIKKLQTLQSASTVHICKNPDILITSNGSCTVSVSKLSLDGKYQFFKNFDFGSPEWYGTMVYFLPTSKTLLIHTSKRNLTVVRINSDGTLTEIQKLENCNMKFYACIFDEEKGTLFTKSEKETTIWDCDNKEKMY